MLRKPLKKGNLTKMLNFQFQQTYLGLGHLQHTRILVGGLKCFDNA